MSRKRIRPSRPEWRAALASAARLGALQHVLNGTPEAAGRKSVILACMEAAAINGEQATLLIQSYQLETA